MNVIFDFGQVLVHFEPRYMVGKYVQDPVGAALLARMRQREGIRVMIHEQYFYTDYFMYQPEFEQKLRATFADLCENGYQSCFFEEMPAGRMRS